MKSRPHQREHELNQQVATAIRPQLPRDGSAGMTKWKTGELPKGGYRSTFDFAEGAFSTKLSPSRAKEKKVY